MKASASASEERARKLQVGEEELRALKSQLADVQDETKVVFFFFSS